jgi:quercetin dioxygenase-like cupin family protein
MFQGWRVVTGMITPGRLHGIAKNIQVTAMTDSRPQAIPTVQVENDRVVVTEWRFPPGAETGWHRHAMDYVVVPQTTGQLLLETADGDITADLTAGQSYSRSEGVEHNVVNANDYEFVFVEVEIKQQ